MSSLRKKLTFIQGTVDLYMYKTGKAKQSMYELTLKFCAIYCLMPVMLGVLVK